MGFSKSLIIKQSSLILVLIGLSTVGYAQSVKTEKATINSKKYEGFSITLNGSEDQVSSFWGEQISAFGKVRKKRDFDQITEFRIEEYHPEAIFFSRVSRRDSLRTQIWIALDQESVIGAEEANEQVNTALKNFVETAPVNFQKYMITQDIAETERALGFTLKQKENLIRENENLGEDLINSEEELVELEEAVEQLKLQILATKQKIENNKEAVIQSDVDLEKIRKVLDAHKERLQKL